MATIFNRLDQFETVWAAITSPVAPNLGPHLVVGELMALVRLKVWSQLRQRDGQ